MKLNANTNLAGAACMLLSAFFLAIIGVIVKASASQTGVWQVSFYRAVVGTLLMLGMAAAFKVKLLGPKRKLLAIRGLLGAIGFLSLTMALRGIPIAEVMVLFYLFPAFAAILSPWISKESFPPANWLFIGLAFGGTFVVISPGGGVHPGMGHLYALITALLAGVNTALVRRLSADHSPYCIFFFFCLAALAVSFLPLAAGVEPLVPSWAGLGWLAAIGAAATVAQLMMNQGFVFLPAAEGGVILMSQVVIAALWGVLLFDEPLTWRLVIGGGLILLGGLGINRAAAARRKRAAVKAGGK